MQLFKRKEQNVKQMLTDEKLYEALKQQIMAMGNFPLEKKISLYDLGDTNAARKFLQLVHQETKGRNLQLNVVEFICYVSTKHIAKKINEMAVSGDEIPVAIRKLIHSDRCDTRNFLRFCHSNEDIMLDILGIESIQDRANVFMQIIAIWYNIRTNEKLIAMSSKVA